MNTLALSVPAPRLPTDSAPRDEILTSYFAERIPNSAPTADGGWTITVSVPPSAEFYVDPRIEEGLRWWGCSVTDVAFAHRTARGVFVSLSDAWALLSMSRWLASQPSPPPHATIIHLDDHDDLMCPRLRADDGRFTDLLTGQPVHLDDPVSVAGAISSGAVGMGSFLAPMLHTLPSVDIRHLCDTAYARTRAGRFWVVRATEPDTILAPDARRPSVHLVPTADGASMPERTSGTYQATDDETKLLANINDGPILLHIDLDFFNNRFNGNSDWRESTDRHDPSHEHVMRRVEQVVDALMPLRHRIVNVTIGISPGFFPAELWAPVCSALIKDLAVDQ